MFKEFNHFIIEDVDCDMDKVIGAYKSLVDLVLPDPSALEYIPFLLYKARTLMLNQVKAVETEDTEAFPLKAARERCRQP
ncbi:hypothetical protein DFH11DRAFT_1878222 [Phellopilus nigrolimitatus]|nr:hypothetical protein DFH11DRAFT_1881415 [Phellopilus nigrolimitatus]KAH8113472.1 hypothetical protein DFH11DRAFT_1878222 [Phellopilus nigrolimitatus]